MKVKNSGYAGAISSAEASILFKDAIHITGIVIAVSGGPDSMALMALMARWRATAEAGPAFHVATIDHGLRPESAGEAQMVAAEALKLGLPHTTLAWMADKPSTGMQEAARNARYQLLLAHAVSVGASHIATAHTQDDQAETLMMRLAAGSGPAGLAGMQHMVRRGDVQHWRPMLGLAKARLVETCTVLGSPYINDPSNQADRFSRSRWRKIMPLLAAEGLDAERLARFARRQAQANQALDVLTAAALGKGVQSAGGLSFAHHALKDAPREIQIRALALAIRHARQHFGANMKTDSTDIDSAPHLRLERLETLTERFNAALCHSKPFRSSLGGMILSLDRHFSLVVRPELARKRGHVHSVVIASLGKGQ